MVELKGYEGVIRQVASESKITIRNTRAVLNSFIDVILSRAMEGNTIPFKIGKFISLIDIDNRAVNIIWEPKENLGSEIWENSLFPKVFNKENKMLINCPECNNKISDIAVTCPNCGYPLKTKIDDGTVNYEKKGGNKKSGKRKIFKG